MELVNLISKNAGLFDQLKSIGLNSDEVVSLAGALNRQLRAKEGPELTDCLTSLDMQGFLDRLDVDEISQQVGVESSVAESAIRLIAPVVQAFDGNPSSVVGKLAGSLLGNR